MKHRTPTPIENYHAQRDELVGRKADHLTPPATYIRGALPQEDKRVQKMSFARRVVLVILFLAFWLFLWFFALMDGSN